MSSYTKHYLPLPDQLQLLKTRGLMVADDAAAINCLHRNGYYRLSAYWYPFRQIIGGQRTDQFLPGSRFEDAVALYRFDKNFKLLLLDALERVEIAARAEIALLLGQRDQFAHEHPAVFHPRFTSSPLAGGFSDYDHWIGKFREQVRRSKDEFVAHHKRRYGIGSPLPIWVAIELWDFGMLSHAFSGLRIPDRQAVAVRFSVPDWRLMESWLRTLNYVRNVIAHHGRLWNLNLNVNPKLPTSGQIQSFDILTTLSNPGTRVYSVCCILSYLTRVVNPQSDWVDRLKLFVSDFPPMPYVRVQDMGFPSGWQGHDFWH